MMQFQCRSLLAFFLLVSASLAKEESVAEHVQTSRHKGRSHKVTNSGAQESLAQEKAGHKSVTSNRVKRESTKLRVLALSKFDVIDDDDGQTLGRTEMLEDYDDVNSFQATSAMQTHCFFNAMDRYEQKKVPAGGPSEPSDDIDEEEFGGFETKMSPDYDDTFDGIATKQIEFLRVFYKFDKNRDHSISNTPGPTDEWPGSDIAFEMADRNSNGEVDFEEFLEQKPCPGLPSKQMCYWMLWEAVDRLQVDGTFAAADNTASLAEWTSMMGGASSASALKMFTEIDTDGDGKITQTEMFLWFGSRTAEGRGIDRDEWQAAQALKLIPDALELEHVDDDGCKGEAAAAAAADDDADLCEADREEFLTMDSHAAMELKMEFDKCDTNPKDQQLTYDELDVCNYLPDMDQNFFDLLDGDDDKDLDYWEFMTSYSELAQAEDGKKTYFNALWTFEGENGIPAPSPFAGPSGNALTTYAIQFDNPTSTADIAILEEFARRRD